MALVSAHVRVGAPLADVWSLYFDPDSWPAWVDGFGSVVEVSGYPLAGGTLRWRSTPAGRGLVSERVLEHEPRRLHRIAFEDEHARGEQETVFEIAVDGEDGPATIVSQTCSYETGTPGLLGTATDLLFVRSQWRRSLRRTLTRLRAEVESEAAREQG